MSKALATAKGIGGELELSEDRVKIKRKGAMGFMGHGLKGDKEILISQISAVQFKKAGVNNGYIQFSFLGGAKLKGVFLTPLVMRIR